MALVPGPDRAPRAGQRPARPGPPRTLLTARLVHAVRIVLEVNARVTNEGPLRAVVQHPGQRPVGQGILLQDRLRSPKLRPQRPVQAEQRPRWQGPAPQGLRVLQAALVEGRVPCLAQSSSARRGGNQGQDGSTAWSGISPQERRSGARGKALTRFCC